MSSYIKLKSLNKLHRFKLTATKIFQLTPKKIFWRLIFLMRICDKKFLNSTKSISDLFIAFPAVTKIRFASFVVLLPAMASIIKIKNLKRKKLVEEIMFIENIFFVSMISRVMANAENMLLIWKIYEKTSNQIPNFANSPNSLKPQTPIEMSWMSL